MKERLYKKETVHAIITVMSTKERFFVVEPIQVHTVSELKPGPINRDAWVVVPANGESPVRNPDSDDNWALCYPTPRVLVLPCDAYYIEVIDTRTCYAWTNDWVEVPEDIDKE